MPYDEKSFLAGVAAGRNMKSWPSNDYIRGGLFAITISITEDDIGTLYLSGRKGCFFELGIDLGTLSQDSDEQFTVFWGDGRQNSFSHDRRIYGIGHNYFTETPNIYQIVVTGLLPEATIEGITQSSWLIIRYDTPLYGPCTSDVNRLFSDNSYNNRIEYIPENFFDVYRQPYNGKDSWGGGGNAFTWNRMENLFRGCRHLKIPETLFDGVNVIDVYSVSGMFQSCILMDSIGDVFSSPGFSTVISCNRVFAFTNALKEVPGDIFRRMTSARSFNRSFAGAGITYIPDDIFSYTKVATDFGYCFAWCKNITSIPDNLFDSVVDSPDLDFEACFYGCSNITGPVPDLWNRFPSCAHHLGCFAGCENASNYNDIPLDWL